MAKYYYNGVLLPEIPVEVLASFPYAWINSTRNGLVVAGYPWYYSSSKMNIPTSAENRKYVLSSDGSTWVLDSTYTDTGGYSVESTPLWSSHDVPNGSATATEIYLYGSVPVREDKAKPKELPYDVYTNFYPSSGTINCPTSDPVVNYVIPVVKHSTYTVTMTEVGNRLRCVYTSVDPATITTRTTGCVDIVMNPQFAAGYTFTYFAQEDGWMVVYVSNADERPKISIVTNGAGGDGAPPYDRKYLVRSGSTFYTITDGTLTVLAETEITASLFQNYGVDNLPDGALLLGLTDPEVLYWHDSEDELPELALSVTGSPPAPQTIITNTQDMSDSTILGIEGIQAICSDDILFALSFDDETTWKAYDGTTWITLDLPNTGMTKTTMESIGLEAWAEVVTSDHYKVRFILPATTSYMTSMVVNYIN